MCNRFTNLVNRFHNDDEGMETIQIIMILAVAAMVCMGVTGVTGVSTSGSAENNGIFGGVGSLVSNLIPGVSLFGGSK